MYVCLCEAVTDQHIITAIAQGCNSVPALRNQLGCGTQCGRCVRTVRNLLRQEQRQPRAPTTARLSHGHAAREAVASQP